MAPVIPNTELLDFVLSQGKGIRIDVLNKFVSVDSALREMIHPARPLHTIYQLQKDSQAVINLPRNQRSLERLLTELQLQILAYLPIPDACCLALTSITQVKVVNLAFWILLHAERRLKCEFLRTWERDLVRLSVGPSRLMCAYCVVLHRTDHFDHYNIHISVPLLRRCCLRGYGEVHLSPQYGFSRSQLLTMRHNERKANFGGILLNDPRIRPHDIYIKVSNGIWPSSKIFCTAIRYGSHLLVETKWAVPELPSGIRYEVDGERLYPNLRLGYPVRHRYGFLCPHADWDHTWPSAQYEIGSRLFGDEKLLERAASYRSRPILQCKYCPTDIGQGLEEFPGYKSCWTVTTWRIISSHIDNPRLDQAFSAQQQTASGFSHVVKLNNLSNYVLGGAIKQLWEKLNSRVDSEEQTPYVLPHLHEILGGHIERFANRLPDSYSRDIEYDRQRNLGIHTKTWGRGSYEARMKNFRAAGLLDEGDNCYNHAYATNVLPESDKSGLCLSTSG